jgi:hypothetical protein
MVPLDDVDRLRAALRDPAALVEDDAAARALFLLRRHALEHLATVVAQSAARVLLVKGAALALSLYPKPWQREMADLDLLVDARDERRLLEALDRARYRRVSAPQDRPWSARAFGETALVLPLGELSGTVEVHTTLDKLVPRPIAHSDVFARALPVPDLDGFSMPCPEDHALLVALHLAASEFHHPVGFVDLELLFRAGLDLEALARRADRWKLRSALYVALAALRALEAPSISADTLTRFFPGRLRRRALGLFYALDSYPAALGTLRLGTWWVLRQTPLRDDLGPWTVGVGRYGLTRALERALARRGRR